jgi:hypothetical protein
MVGHGIAVRAALFLVITPACASQRPPGRTENWPIERAWREGPRDRELAGAMACALLRSVGRDGQECIMEGVRETAGEYVVRIQAKATSPPPAEPGARIEVRLTKDGTSATVQQLAMP